MARFYFYFSLSGVFRFGRGLGPYVTLLYLLVKSLYVTNVEDRFSEKYEDVPFAGEEPLED